MAPRIRSAPSGRSSLGKEAIDLAAQAGLKLDAWQQQVLRYALRRRGKRWAAFEVGVLVPRQNGKGAILEARELVALFLTKDSFTIHSAHQFDTSMEAFLRLLALIESTPWLDSQVLKVVRSHGEEGIWIRGGPRIRFRTRTRGGGRGFSCDTLILDEAMFLPEFAFGALLPTLSARPNPQVFYAGSAVDQEVHEHGLVLARVRERGIAGDDPSLVYCEWSLDLDHPAKVSDEVAGDEASWRLVNPAMPFRILPEHVAREQRSLDARTFAVERLNVGDWPRTDGETGSVIPLERWDALMDSRSVMVNPVCLAFDVSPERSASIAAAGRNQDGRWQVEVWAHRGGTSWLPARLTELAERHQPAIVVCDGYGPSGSLLHAVEEAGAVVQTVTASEHGQACGLLSDAVAEDNLRHLGSDELRRAVKSAATRPLGDAWAWSRKASNVDISPLVAGTLALWAAMQNTRTASDIRIW